MSLTLTASASSARPHAVSTLGAPALDQEPGMAAMRRSIDVDLEWPGWACAVAKAHSLVLQAADEVVGSNDGDGVARKITPLFS